MFQILLVFHIIICVLLILVVLMQTGLGSQLGAAFTAFKNQNKQLYLNKKLCGIKIQFS